MENITISQIAELAGVSKTTVSRVLNKKPDVSAETRDKIEGIIQQYNFSPNAFASAILTKKSDTIALVIPYDETYVLFNPYYSDMIRGVSNEIKKHGYYLLLVYSDTTDYIAAIRQKRVDGIIMLSPGRSHKGIIEEILRLNVPFVSTSRTPGIARVHSIVTDDYKGAQLAVDHLLSLGHKKIGFINGPAILASSTERLRGYKQALGKKKIAFDASLVINGDTSIQSGYEIAKGLLKKRGLTAIFTASDLMAIGTISAAHELGLRIPDDLSLVGFDDMPFSAFLSPPLTTVRQHAFKKGCLAARMLVSIIEELPVEQRIEMPVELVVRQSTKKRG
ncbi:MAG: LacI family transcriptional regulator [Clostridiales Family XIII bacterium]|jgi:LacI family transcriptional regulator|nr:LacI family transcriptional regulator [Clostridiales Family XIII bacterium]